jgi:hypothetical protein
MMDATRNHKGKRGFLVVVQGTPHVSGTRFPIPSGSLSIGRISSDFIPDIAFDSTLISRNHLSIESRDGIYFAVDMGSKNGSSLNGTPFDEGVQYEMHDGDRLGMAGSDVVLAFLTEEDSGTESAGARCAGPAIGFDDERREITISGKTLRLSGNLYELFGVLYRNRGRAVSNEEIRKAVWPERAHDERGVPNAADLEITNIVKRLREKLGDGGGLIRNCRGYGYILDTGQGA